MRYLTQANTLVLDPSLCNGCRRCAEVCPHAVFRMAERKAHLIDHGACMECGACARNCAPGALTVRSGAGCAFVILRDTLLGVLSRRGVSTGGSSCE